MFFCLGWPLPVGSLLVSSGEVEVSCFDRNEGVINKRIFEVKYG